jgi:hypothetical protein
MSFECAYRRKGQMCLPQERSDVPTAGKVRCAYRRKGQICHQQTVFSAEYDGVDDHICSLCGICDRDHITALGSSQVCHLISCRLYEAGNEELVSAHWP